MRAPLTVEKFASDVRTAVAVAPRDEGGFFGSGIIEKMFIAYAWAWMRRNWREFGNQYQAITLSAFKSMLIVAQKQRLLTLSRADLVGAMDPGMVAKSEIRSGNATYNFIN